jgi:hypothetical protein
VLKIDDGVGVGTGVGVGETETPGDTDVVGVDGGRAGAVGQLASAGLNGLGVGVATTGVGEGVACDDALGVAVATAVGVTRYGV